MLESISNDVLRAIMTAIDDTVIDYATLPQVCTTLRRSILSNPPRTLNLPGDIPWAALAASPTRQNALVTWFSIHAHHIHTMAIHLAASNHNGLTLHPAHRSLAMTAVRLSINAALPAPSILTQNTQDPWGSILPGLSQLKSLTLGSVHVNLLPAIACCTTLTEVVFLHAHHGQPTTTTPLNMSDKIVHGVGGIITTHRDDTCMHQTQLRLRVVGPCEPSALTAGLDRLGCLSTLEHLEVNATRWALQRRHIHATGVPVPPGAGPSVADAATTPRGDGVLHASPRGDVATQAVAPHNHMTATQSDVELPSTSLLVPVTVVEAVRDEAAAELLWAARHRPVRYPVTMLPMTGQLRCLRLHIGMETYECVVVIAAAAACLASLTNW